MEQSHSMATQVGVRTGSLVQGQCNGLWLQRLGQSPSTELKGQSSLEIDSGLWGGLCTWVWGLENTIQSGWNFPELEKNRVEGGPGEV